MFGPVNLLLLLSALLSALSGFGEGARAPQMTVVAARAADAATVHVARSPVAVRPRMAPPKLIAVSISTGTALLLAPTVPLFLSRRRE